MFWELVGLIFAAIAGYHAWRGTRNRVAQAVMFMLILSFFSSCF